MVTQIQADKCWEALSHYDITGKALVLSEEEKEFVREFAYNQRDAAIESYQRYSYHHGGFDEEAKEREGLISKFEKFIDTLY